MNNLPAIATGLTLPDLITAVNDRLRRIPALAPVAPSATVANPKVTAGSGTTVTTTGDTTVVALAYGTGLKPDGKGFAMVNLAPSFTTLKDQTTGLTAITGLKTDGLAPGTTTVTGTFTFQYSPTGAMVQIYGGSAGAGVLLADNAATPSNTVALSPTGMSLQASYTDPVSHIVTQSLISITASGSAPGISMRGPTCSLQLSSGGVVSTSSYTDPVTHQVSNSSVSIAGNQIQMLCTGQGSLTLNANQVAMAMGSFNVTLDAGKIRLSSGGSAGNPDAVLTAVDLTFSNHASAPNNASVVLGQQALTLTGGTHQAQLTSAQFLISNTGNYSGYIYISAYGPTSGVNIGLVGAQGEGTVSLACNAQSGCGTVSVGTSSNPGQVLISGAGAIQIGGNTVLGARKPGPGAPAGFSDGAAQTWCTNLYNALRAVGGHGLIN